jgi:hypothetical protein
LKCKHYLKGKVQLILFFMNSSDIYFIPIPESVAHH